jgi:hypothetical protein
MPKTESTIQIRIRIAKCHFNQYLYCGVNWNTWKKTTDVLQVTDKVVVVFT